MQVDRTLRSAGGEDGRRPLDHLTGRAGRDRAAGPLRGLVVWALLAAVLALGAQAVDGHDPARPTRARRRAPGIGRPPARSRPVASRLGGVAGVSVLEWVLEVAFGIEFEEVGCFAPPIRRDYAPWPGSQPPGRAEPWPYQPWPGGHDDPAPLLAGCSRRVRAPERSASEPLARCRW
jgi:hypothetical protein